MELILKYFPRLTEKQKEQFAALYDIYRLEQQNQRDFT